MLRKSLALLSFSLLAPACQTYDFEQVQPLALAQTTRSRDVAAKKPKPNLMLVVDKSGSMNDVDSAGTQKITALRSAMQGFLSQAKMPARVGLVMFPSAQTSCQGAACCTAASSVEVNLSAPRTTEDDADDAAKAQAALARINTVPPSGGTPTNLTLQFVGGLAGLQDATRQNFVLLLTDGEPNCNPANQSTCLQPSACRCTVASCGTDVSSTFCTLGCLDQNGSVDAIQQLRAKNIKTIVVGFGVGQAGSQGAQVLGAMSMAGDFPRKCTTDANCGTGGCNTTTSICNVPFYQAANGAELVKALNDIQKVIDDGRPPCVFALDTTAPVNPALIAVIFGDKNLTMGPDTWMYEDFTYNGVVEKDVVFKGEYCKQIEASNTENPLHVEIRAVEQL